MGVTVVRTGHAITVALWESTWGREGLWCRPCRRATPVEQLVLEPSGRAALLCETCAQLLRTGPSWLTSVAHARQRIAHESLVS